MNKGSIYCSHECYEDCPWCLANLEDESSVVKADDLYGPDCILYELEHSEENFE